MGSAGSSPSTLRSRRTWNGAPLQHPHMRGRMPNCSEPRRRWRRRRTGFDALALIGTEGTYDQTSGRSDESTHHAQLFHLGTSGHLNWWLDKHYPQSYQYAYQSVTDPDKPQNPPVKSVPLIPLRID